MWLHTTQTVTEKTPEMNFVGLIEFWLPVLLMVGTMIVIVLTIDIIHEHFKDG